jgi:branched-chain amino acid transport system ATP-binding protein
MYVESNKTASVVPLLQVSRVSKSFGGLRAVEDVSFDVQQGEIVGVIGPNGAGKTTLFNVITGLLPLSAGSMRLGPHELDKVTSHLRIKIGMVRTFQIVRLVGELTVLENVMLGSHSALTRGLLKSVLTFPKVYRDEEAARVKAMEMLGFVGLADHADDIAAHLPHGKQRLVEISRALVASPSILLLDEPAAGLNGTETAHLNQLLKTLNRQGMTILVVEHDMPFVMSLCDRIVVLDHGSKLAEGTPAEIRVNPLVIDAYLGKEGGHAVG